MTLMIGLHHSFLEMSKNCWPRFRVRNSRYLLILRLKFLFNILNGGRVHMAQLLRNFKGELRKVLQKVTKGWGEGVQNGET
jgi:hypothetical protein